jgi:hypothetical protein
MRLRDRASEAERLEDSGVDGNGGSDAAIRERLRRLAAAERNVAAPVQVEWQVMRAWDQKHPAAPVRKRRWVRWTAVPAAAAVALACAVTLARFARPLPQLELQTPSLPARPADARLDLRDNVLDATEVPARLPARRAQARRVAPPPASAPHAVNVVLVGTPVSPGEQVRVVRVRIARATLAAMGLRAVGATDDETVDVDMLVGEDGVARGLRVGM